MKKATLGIVSQITGSEASLSNGLLETSETAVITQVTEGALAYGKLKVGDVLKSITIKGEKIQVKRRYQFNDMLLNVRMGDSIVISVLRDGSIVDVQFTFDKDSHFTTMS